MWFVVIKPTVDDGGYGRIDNKIMCISKFRW